MRKTIKNQFLFGFYCRHREKRTRKAFQNSKSQKTDKIQYKDSQHKMLQKCSTIVQGSINVLKVFWQNIELAFNALRRMANFVISISGWGSISQNQNRNLKCFCHILSNVHSLDRRSPVTCRGNSEIFARKNLIFTPQIPGNARKAWHLDIPIFFSNYLIRHSVFSWN